LRFSSSCCSEALRFASVRERFIPLTFWIVTRRSISFQYGWPM